MLLSAVPAPVPWGASPVDLVARSPSVWLVLMSVTTTCSISRQWSRKSTSDMVRAIGSDLANDSHSATIASWFSLMKVARGMRGSTVKVGFEEASEG